MGIYWDWAFGNETTATLTSEVGFAFSTADALATSSDTYTYSGSPTRYALGYATNSTNSSVQRSMTLPVGAGLTEGIVSFPFRLFATHSSYVEPDRIPGFPAWTRFVGRIE